MSDELRLRAKIGALEAQMKHLQRDRDLGERDRMQAAQARCDGALSRFGDRAPDPAPMDDELAYRNRLCGAMAKHSSSFSTSRFDRHPAEILDVLESKLLQELGVTARNDANMQVGRLVPVQERDMAGRLITRFEGDIGAFMAPFVPEGMTCRMTRPEGKLPQ